MIVYYVFAPFSSLFQLYRGDQSTYPCFPEVLLISTLHNILSKPLAAFPQWNNVQRWERDKSCLTDHHQSSERILDEPENRTSDLLLSSLLSYSCATGSRLKWTRPWNQYLTLINSISMDESNTVVSAYTLYRHLQQYCSHPSNYEALTLFSCKSIHKSVPFVMSRPIPYPQYAEWYEIYFINLWLICGNVCRKMERFAKITSAVRQDPSSLRQRFPHINYNLIK